MYIHFNAILSSVSYNDQTAGPTVLNIHLTVLTWVCEHITSGVVYFFYTGKSS